MLTSSTHQTKQPAAVQHVGNGVYDLSAILQRTGHHQLQVQLVEQSAAAAAVTSVLPVQLEVVCVPAALAAEQCRVELQREAWVAGRAAAVVVHRHDRYRQGPIHHHIVLPGCYFTRMLYDGMHTRHREQPLPALQC